jgi:hypothetical protein
MAFSIETSLNPFWAEGKGFINGRDPLGIQNSSVSIYAALLPGLNNVTDRLRYYGFYCWLLKRIDDKKLSFETRQDQYNYIRKAEYMLAVYMSECEPEQQGIAGSAFAVRKLRESRAAGENFIDIKNGAEKHSGTEKGSVFWDFKAGILGQYYAGSLQDNYAGLGLIRISAGFYFVTEVGKQLGAAYGKTVGSIAEKLFDKTISSGILQLKDIVLLADFSISKIQLTSDEGKFYTNSLFSTDFSLRTDSVLETTYRRDSLLLFLDSLTDFNEERDFQNLPELLYQKAGLIGQKSCSDASIGWFYYYCCERMHISVEFLFYAILKEIETKRQTIKAVSDTLTSTCLKGFDNCYTNFPEEMMLSELIELVQEESDVDYVGVMDSNDKGEGLVYAIEYFLLTYKTVKVHENTFKTFTYTTRTRDKNGTALDWAHYVDKKLSSPIDKFIAELLIKIMNDHLHVAYSKMGNGDEQVHKFILEDNNLIHINNIAPRFTTPRLKTVRNFLQDVGIIKFDEKEGYIITKAGEEILKPYK